MFYLFHSVFLCSQGHSHIGIHFHCNWERTLHHFDKVRLSMVSVKKAKQRQKLRMCTGTFSNASGMFIIIKCLLLNENGSCMQFHFHANQSHFHKNDLTLRLVLKQRHKDTQKFLIVEVNREF